MIITSVPWAWGFADGAQGGSIYAGYHLFTDYKLAEYKRGWAAGRQAIENSPSVAKPDRLPGDLMINGVRR